MTTHRPCHERRARRISKLLNSSGIILPPAVNTSKRNILLGNRLRQTFASVFNGQPLHRVFRQFGPEDSRSESVLRRTKNCTVAVYLLLMIVNMESSKFIWGSFSAVLQIYIFISKAWVHPHPSCTLRYADVTLLFGVFFSKYVIYKVVNLFLCSIVGILLIGSIYYLFLSAFEFWPSQVYLRGNISCYRYPEFMIVPHIPLENAMVFSFLIPTFL